MRRSCPDRSTVPALGNQNQLPGLTNGSERSRFCVLKVNVEYRCFIDGEPTGSKEMLKARLIHPPGLWGITRFGVNPHPGTRRAIGIESRVYPFRGFVIAVAGAIHASRARPRFSDAVPHFEIVKNREVRPNQEQNRFQSDLRNPIESDTWVATASRGRGATAHRRMCYPACLRC
jgi:hypothetical protein